MVLWSVIFEQVNNLHPFTLSEFKVINEPAVALSWEWLIQRFYFLLIFYVFWFIHFNRKSPIFAACWHAAQLWAPPTPEPSQ